MPRTNAPHSLAAFTPTLLASRYPNRAPWAINAFWEIRHSSKVQHGLSPEARAILNICVLPIPGFRGTKEDLVDARVDIRPMFATQKNYDDNKAEIDLWRLSGDVNRVWKN